MNIPFRQRQLVIEVEKVAPTVAWDAALEGATDREMEHFVRASHITREPRWEVQATVYGFHL